MSLILKSKLPFRNVGIAHDQEIHWIPSLHFSKNLEEGVYDGSTLGPALCSTVIHQKGKVQAAKVEGGKLYFYYQMHCKCHHIYADTGNIFIETFNSTRGLAQGLAYIFQILIGCALCRRFHRNNVFAQHKEIFI